MNSPTRVYGRYRVRGERAYQDHDPGSEFTTGLTPRREARLIRMGALELLERVTITLADVPYTFPSGWIENIPPEAERAARLSTLERGR